LDLPSGVRNPEHGPWIEVQQNGQATGGAAHTDRQDVDVTRPQTPVYVRCFGDLEVLGDGQPISVEGAKRTFYQPREILAFLVCQPGAMATKDLLLATFWREVDDQRANRRLTNALVRLRDWLEEKVPSLSRIESQIVRREGDGTCTVDRAVVSSDAQEFLDLVRSAAARPPAEARHLYERARALYRGDLLARPTMAWVDERGEDGVTLREYFRERHRRATLELARLYREAGDVHLAVPLYRDLLRRDPALEDVARHLYRCYQQLGDVRALILEDRRLRQAIQEAMADPDDPDDDPSLYEPHEETVAVFHEVLADLQQRAAARAIENGSEGRTQAAMRQ
jgi:DNA-binding SARP family transcriptional activator